MSKWYSCQRLPRSTNTCAPNGLEGIVRLSYSKNTGEDTFKGTLGHVTELKSVFPIDLYWLHFVEA